MTPQSDRSLPPPVGPRRVRRTLAGAVRRGAALLLVAAIALTLVAGLALLLIQQPAVGRWALTRILGAAARALGDSVTIGAVRGNWITSIEVRDLGVRRADTVLARVDTLQARYSLPALLGHRIVVHELDVRGAFVTIGRSDTARRPGPSWGPAEILGGRFWSGMPIRIEQLSLTRCGFRGAAAGQGPSVERIELAIRNAALGGGPLAFELDTLGARFLPPGTRDRWCTVGARGSLGHDRLEVRSFALRSAASEVAAAGTLTLTAAPRDTITGADFSLRAPRLELADLGILMPGAAPSGVVTAAAELHGTRIGAMRGTARLTTDGARYGALTLGRTRVEAGLDSGRVNLDLASVVERVPIVARGWVRPFAASLSGAFDGRTGPLPREIPGAPWWDSLATRTGWFHLALERGVLRVDARMQSGSDAMALAGSLDLDRAPRYTAHRVTLAHTDTSGTARPGGALAADSLEAHLERIVSYRVWGARLQHLDLARWTRQPGLASDLNGVLEGAGRGWSPIDARATLRLEPSRFHGQPLERAEIALALAHNELSVKGDIEAPSGHLALTGHARPFDHAPSYVVEDARLDGVDVGPWTGGPAFHTRLTGSLAGRIALPGLGAVDASLALLLSRSEVNGFPLEAGDVRGSLDHGRFEVRARLDSREGAFTLTGSGDLEARPPRIEAGAQAPNLLIARCLGLDSVEVAGTTRLHLEASDARLGGANAHGELASSGRIGTATLDTLEAEIGISKGVFAIDTLLLRSNVALIAGGGRLVLPGTAGPAASDALQESDLRLSAKVLDPMPLAPLLHIDTLDVASASFDGRVTGPASAPRLDLSGHVRALVAGSLHLLDLKARAGVALDRPLHVAHGQATASLERLVSPGLRVSSATASVEREGAVTRLDVRAQTETHREAHVSGSVTSDSVAQHIEIATLDVVSGPRRWRLVQPAHLTLGHDRFEVASFEARSDSGQVVAHGAIDRRGTQDFSLDLSEVRLDTFSSWLGLPDLKGTIAGSVRLEGPAAAPRAHAEIALAMNTDEADAGTAHAAVGWDASRLTLDAAFTPAAGAPLTLAGHLPFGLSLEAPDSAGAGGFVRPVAGDADVRLRGDGVLLSSLAPLLDHKSVIPEQGTLSVDAHLSGTHQAPALSGRFELTGGVIELPGMGVTYSDIELDAGLKGDRLTLTRARATSGKGSVTAAGNLRLRTLTRSEIAIDIHPRGFTPIRTRDTQAVVSGDLALRGSISDPVVSGALTLQDSNFYLAAAQTEGSASSAVTLSAADYRMLEETFGYTVSESPNLLQQIYEASRLDLDLTLAGNTWVRQRTSPRLAVQLTGKFKVKKPPHGVPELFGRIAPVPGRGSVEQFARQFEFTGGEILLNGPMKDHLIDVKTEFKVKSGFEETSSKVVVHLDVQGKLDNLKLILSSDPPLDQSEIISYIITGRTASEAAKTSSDKSSEAASVATQIGMAGVTAKLEDYAQQAVGLDVVEVRQDGLQGTTLIAGRYVTPELYLGFRQPVGYTETNNQTSGTANHTQYELDYAAYQWMSLQLLGATSEFKSYIRARHAY